MITSEIANRDGSNPYGNTKATTYRQYPTLIGEFKLANDFGLYDMHGNVWEWCSDWYDETYYQVSPTVNPQGAAEGSKKVSRGGCWGSSALFCRSADRNGNCPNNRTFNLGFRVVMDVP